MRTVDTIVDRSEGGSSIRDGSIELMVHRRTLHDDALGVGEPMNETAYGDGLVVRGRHLLIVEPPASSALYHRVESQQLYMHPLATFSLTPWSYANYSSAYVQTWSALSDVLPLNVHLLTYEQLSPKEFLIRLEHYFEMKEDDTYSSPATVDLQSLFKVQGLISATVELTLGANLPLADMQRLTWTVLDETSNSASGAQSTFLEHKHDQYERRSLSLCRRTITGRHEDHPESNADPNVPRDIGMNQ